MPFVNRKKSSLEIFCEYDGCSWSSPTGSSAALEMHKAKIHSYVLNGPEQLRVPVIEQHLPIPVVQVESTIVDIKSPWQCTFENCSWVNQKRNKAALNLHVRRKHGDDSAVEPESAFTPVTEQSYSRSYAESAVNSGNDSVSSRTRSTQISNGRQLDHPSIAKSRLSCSLCSKSFVYKSGLSTHSSKVHNQDTASVLSATSIDFRSIGEMSTQNVAPVNSTPVKKGIRRVNRELTEVGPIIPSFNDVETSTNGSITSTRRSDRIRKLLSDQMSVQDQSFVDMTSTRPVRNRNNGKIDTSTRKGTKQGTPRKKLIADDVDEPLLNDTRERTTRKEHGKKKRSEELENLRKQFPGLDDPIEITDVLHMKLKSYHDHLLLSTSNTSTEKLTDEVKEVVNDIKLIDAVNRAITCGKESLDRLDKLNADCKKLPIPETWTWAAASDTVWGRWNEAVMNFWLEKDLQTKIIPICPKCLSSGILVGVQQIDSNICYDCMVLERNEKHNKKKKTNKPSAATKLKEAWPKVRPATNNFPCRSETGFEGQELPTLTVGEASLIAAIHPAVTITKNHIADRKYKEESISLLQNTQDTWSKYLPRTDLKQRFMIMERSFKDTSKRYIIFNPESCRQWLMYLFTNHPEYVRMSANHQLEFSQAAVETLKSQNELAEVIYDNDDPSEHDAANYAIVQSEMVSGLSKTEVYTFDKYPNLYLNDKQVLKIKQKGLIEIIEDTSVRRPCYNASANMCFPNLYPNGEMSPLDFGDYKLAKQLLKKQALFAHQMKDGSYKYQYAENSVHMMHQYARLKEQQIHCVIGYYLSQHPESLLAPMDAILASFKEGRNEEGLIDSHLPDLSMVMSQIPNTRERWLMERLGIETVSRDLGAPNLFLTLNMDVRAWPDVRSLIYRLENGEHSVMNANYFEKDTDRHTELLSKYAVQISIYLYLKTKSFLQAFFVEVLRIPKENVDRDWSESDRTNNGWSWTRSEFTETRGVQHWHCLAKIPNVLDTALLGRIIHNGRVVRQEMKCGNIKPGFEEKAWVLIEMGLLANRYVTLFTESMSKASFYEEPMNVDEHEAEKVIKLEDLRQEYVNNYKDGEINRKTHPLMRTCKDKECDKNRELENAKTAAVCCIHSCMGSCGGNVRTGDGCRFGFPKPLMNHTVPAVLQVNFNQMEVNMLIKRTCDRVPNLNDFLLRWWKANHDCTVLVDFAQALRYCAKYVSKSKKQTEVMDEVIEYLGKRLNDPIPPNMKQALNHLVLADCAHRTFISKHELAYKVMDLPMVMKSFNNIGIVGLYRRGTYTQSYDGNTIVYSDRTEYSAYAERMDSKNVCKRFDKAELEKMCFREFAETISRQWEKKKDPEVVTLTRTKKVLNRDINSGYWVFRKLPKRKINRWNTVIYAEPPHLYEPLEEGLTTTQTLYHDLPKGKREQLARAYQELVEYMPWQKSPEETFLSAEDQKMLEDVTFDPEHDRRYSLRRLEMFHKKYMELWHSGQVAMEGTHWHRENQFSYSMYMAGLQNRDIRMDRAANSGVFKATYEAADELIDATVELRVPLTEQVEEEDVPSALNFLPADTFREVMLQKPPIVWKIEVAFPLMYQFQRREEMVTCNKSTLFMADPPEPTVPLEKMTFWHKKAFDLMTRGSHQVCYLYGKAGCGKSELALHVAKYFKGACQAGAGTGRAASNFRGPTTHAMFGLSHDEFKQARTGSYQDNKINRLRVFYEKTEVFVIDEVNAISAAQVGLLDEIMQKIFNPDGKLKNEDGTPKVFGGKKMLLMGDSAQLRPVGGVAIYDRGQTGMLEDCSAQKRGSYVTSQAKLRTARGQQIYNNYLSKNCIWLKQGFRNRGLLEEIFDRVRNGEQTRDDLDKIMYQNRKFPDIVEQSGIHYSNESCTLYNYRHLWSTCQQQQPPARMYISRASYHTTGDNDLVVKTLSAIPANQYKFAPDVLCVSEGCEVRLIKNINVAAGLVNSASGTVRLVVYNNADVAGILRGEHPPAYCIVVHFPGFRGFLKPDSDEREFPLSDPHLVPLYRMKFLPDRVPGWIRKGQSPSSTYREQFPIDLSKHITAHRAQGCTMKNRTVSVNLGLQSPDDKVPLDVGSLLYVACTRVNELKNLFVAPIFPTTWDQIGKSEVDKLRRQAEERLLKEAEKFAISIGAYKEFVEEQAFVPDYSNNEKEWQEMLNAENPPTYVAEEPMDMGVDADDWFAAAESEIHIGIDQGIENFAMTVVAFCLGYKPQLVAAEVYNLRELGLNVNKFDATALVHVLQTNTPLMSWMQHHDYPEFLDWVAQRVIVHIEQISKKNKYNKQFTIDFGRFLQTVLDPKFAIVKLSSPHVHRRTGPMFKMGKLVIDACQLEPVVNTAARKSQKRKNAVSTSSEPKRKKKRSANVIDSDVEPDSSETEDESPPMNDYRRKKNMSSKIFQYLIDADEEQQEDLGITVLESFQTTWKERRASKQVTKFDDLGDSFLHAVDELLCGSTSYRQLIPATPSLHINRTVVLAVYPDSTYWAVIHCTWNLFTVEDLGVMETSLPRNATFLSPETVHTLKNRLESNDSLKLALTVMDQSEAYAAVDHIKTVVKQLTSSSTHGLADRKAAGALTNSAIDVAKMICDEAATENSTLVERNIKPEGWSYTRTMAGCDKKFKVIRSTGKHTSAMVCCLEWAKKNLGDFVETRPIHMCRAGKLRFFDSLRQLSAPDVTVRRMEMLTVSEHAASKIMNGIRFEETRAMLADLVLIGLNLNCQFVSAIASSYRSNTATKP